MAGIVSKRVLGLELVLGVAVVSHLVVGKIDHLALDKFYVKLRHPDTGALAVGSLDSGQKHLEGPRHTTKRLIL